MTELATNVQEFTASSEFNALDFFVRSIVKGMVNTAIPVRVDTIERPGDGAGAGYLTATPLIKMRSAAGDALPPVSFPKLRWFRPQHGTAAIICDPKPGDVGLAVFAQQDVSTLTGGKEPMQPGSFRCFDFADGFYFGGFWGPTPSTFIRIEDTGDITVTAPATHTTNSPKVTVNCETAQVNASSSVTFDTPQGTFTGNLTVRGHINGQGGLSISGGSGAAVDGAVAATGDVTAGGISLQGHTHTEQGDGAETSPAH